MSMKKPFQYSVQRADFAIVICGGGTDVGLENWRAGYQMSEWHACRLMGLGDRRTAIRKGERISGLRTHLKELAVRRMRFGYRRLTAMLLREYCENSSHEIALRLIRSIAPCPAHRYRGVEKIVQGCEGSGCVRFVTPRCRRQAHRPNHDRGSVISDYVSVVLASRAVDQGGQAGVEDSSAERLRCQFFQADLMAQP